MKILLQDLRTRRYLADADRWSESPGQARVFASVNEARRFSAGVPLDLGIVALLGGAPLDVAQSNPVPDRGGAARPSSTMPNSKP